MITTEKGFKLPDENDFYDIQDFNDNFERADIILREFDAVSDRVDTLEQKYADDNENGSSLLEKIDTLESKLDYLKLRLNVANYAVFERIAFMGEYKGVCTTGKYTAVKSVTIPGFTLTDGVIFGVVFANGNGYINPTLRINDGTQNLSDIEMWDEKGRIGNGNQTIDTYSGMYNVFRYNQALNRFIWIMAMQQVNG
ncbi:MAG: hypothetical protein FWF94_05525 [Oscillospiraceae bacterium]|nr:hypothetical protein [Oscillospiraceae bacterium]